MTTVMHWTRTLLTNAWRPLSLGGMVLALTSASCEPSKAPGSTEAQPAVSPAKVASVRLEASSNPPKAPQPPAKPKLQRERYPWLATDATQPVAVEPLEARYDPPEGFTRVAVTPNSFGEWLRGLPLAKPGTPVRTYGGTIRYSADDRRIASVAALDVGTADLQHCADVVMRLHGEWQWSQGKRDIEYRAAAGMALPFERFSRGEFVGMDGSRLTWKSGGRGGTGHEAFRRYLDMVFAWANTGSLSQQAGAVAAHDARPGDFFVLPGNPGHTVLIVDMARDAQGHTVALIGQSYMPAQNFYVLRGDRDPWFTLDAPNPVDTPFWDPFPWSSLRRLD